MDSHFPAKPYPMSPAPEGINAKGMTPALATLTGFLYASLPTYAHVITVGMAKPLFYLYSKACEDLFGRMYSGRGLNHNFGEPLRNWMREHKVCSNTYPDVIPDAILQSNREAAAAFVRTFMEVRGRKVGEDTFILDSFSETFLKQFHVLLWKLGVLSRRHKVSESGASWWRITMQGNQIARFQNAVGFYRPMHQNWATSLSPEVRPASTFTDRVESWEHGMNTVVDLEIDHKDHTFIGNGITCHNTLQSIAASCLLWDKNVDMKVVVVTIKSAVRQWASEFKRFTDGVTVYVCSGPPEKRAKIYSEFENHSGSPAVLVMGYGSLLRDIHDIKHWTGFTLFIDEASAIKNHATQTHKIVRYMSEKSDRVVGLTATMVENNLEEAWALYNALVPGLFGNRTWFLETYCVTRMMPIPGSSRKVPKVVGYKPGAIEAFKNNIYPYYLGRAKMDVAKELPPLTRRTIMVGMSPAQEAKYAEALSGLLTVEKNGIIEEKETDKLTSIIYCQQITDHPKLIGAEGSSEKMDMLMELLTEGELSDCKVVVYSRFKSMINIIMDELAERKINAVRITGDENEKQREANKTAFQDPNSGVRVICITSASKQGVNLQSGKAIIFVDTPWSAGDFLQIVGRILRIGSKHDNVYAIHLVTENTIDGHVMKALSRKMKLVEAVLGKRIKGDADEVIEVAPENDISDLFDALRGDASKYHKGSR
jgi:superfamily II DNA or RNA helicase